MPLKEYDTIRLRDEIQGTLGEHDAIATADRKRTPDRDRVAQYILSEVIPRDRWPMNMTDLAEETDYSRQLVSEVVADYFVGVDHTESEDERTMSSAAVSPMSTNSPNNDETQQGDDERIPDNVFVLVDGHYKEISIEVPDDIEDKLAYKRGFLDGLRV